MGLEFCSTGVRDSMYSLHYIIKAIKPESEILVWEIMFSYAADFATYHFSMLVLMISYDWNENNENLWTILISIKDTLISLHYALNSVTDDTISAIFHLLVSLLKFRIVKCCLIILLYGLSQYVVYLIFSSLYRKSRMRYFTGSWEL